MSPRKPTDKERLKELEYRSWMRCKLPDSISDNTMLMLSEMHEQAFIKGYRAAMKADRKGRTK